MHLSCDYTVNGGNERCNAYVFDSVGFCRKFLVRFLQVVGFSGRTRNSLKPCFGDVRPVEFRPVARIFYGWVRSVDYTDQRAPEALFTRGVRGHAPPGNFEN